MFQLRHNGKGIWFGQFSLFPQEGLVHGISTRLGGVSKLPFASLNMALHTGDEADAVCANRRLFCETLCVKPERLVTLRQVHGERVHRVRSDEAGRGSKVYDDSVLQADALITNELDVPLMLCFADCVPVLFYDPVQRVVAAAHAGWKGTVSRIAQKTVQQMRQECNSRPEDVLAGIAPAIGPCCFEVSEAVSEKFCKAFPQYPEIISYSSEGRIFIDLWAANRLQLEEEGLLPRHIDSADVCTKCSAELFYSYRKAQGTTGRFAALISLTDVVEQSE